MYLVKEEKTFYSIYAGEGTEGIYNLTKQDLIDIRNSINKELQESEINKNKIVFNEKTIAKMLGL